MTGGEPLVVRDMRPEDVAAACAVVAQFDATLTDEAEQAFRADLERLEEWPGERCRVVAQCGGRIVGTMGYTRGPIPNAGIFWTDWLMVDREWRRRGVASRIYLDLESRLRAAGARKVYLDVGTVYKQPDALAFHSRHGYAIEGILRDYWAPGDDLVVMAKDFGAGAGRE